MAAFCVGDRVRFGRIRGGVIVKADGQLRVQFPPATQLIWLDHVVPDEGPDGQIFPDSWDRCEVCGQPTVSDRCVNCVARDTRADRAFDRNETAREHREAIERGEPSFGIHVASSIRYHGRTTGQVCARCGVLLNLYSGSTVTDWPEGALVERHYLGLSLAGKHVTEATCTPVRELVGAR